MVTVIKSVALPISIQRLTVLPITLSMDYKRNTRHVLCGKGKMK